MAKWGPWAHGTPWQILASKPKQASVLLYHRGFYIISTNKQIKYMCIYIYYYVIINNLFLKIFKVDYVNFYVVQILHFSPLLGTRQSFNQMYVISVGCA